MVLNVVALGWCRPTDGATPLWMAASHGRLSVIKYLVQDQRVAVDGGPFCRRRLSQESEPPNFHVSRHSADISAQMAVRMCRDSWRRLPSVPYYFFFCTGVDSGQSLSAVGAACFAAGLAEPESESRALHLSVVKYLLEDCNASPDGWQEMAVYGRLDPEVAQFVRVAVCPRQPFETFDLGGCFCFLFLFCFFC